MKIKQLKQARGFTIIELMIALSVLSVILLIASTLLIRIGSAYTKGVNMAALQNTNRNIVSDISSSLQFTGKKPFPCANNSDNTTCAAGTASDASGVKVYAFCVDKTRYSYVLGRKQGDDNSFDPVQTTKHVLWQDTMASTVDCNPINVNLTSIDTPHDSVTTDKGYDMVPKNMRLNKFLVTDSAGDGTYTITVWLSYGDNDLLGDGSGGGTCKGDKGQQFCAVSKITTTVQKRINVNN